MTPVLSQAHTLHWALLISSNCSALSFLTPMLWEAQAMLCGCPSFLGFPTCILMIRFRLCISDQGAVLVIMGLCGLLFFPILCGFPVFCFLAFGKILITFGFPSHVHHPAGTGGLVRGIGWGWQVFPVLEKEGGCLLWKVILSDKKAEAMVYFWAGL